MLGFIGLLGYLHGGKWLWDGSRAAVSAACCCECYENCQDHCINTFKMRAVGTPTGPGCCTRLDDAFNQQAFFSSGGQERSFVALSCTSNEYVATTTSCDDVTPGVSRLWLEIAHVAPCTLVAKIVLQLNTTLGGDDGRIEWTCSNFNPKNGCDTAAEQFTLTSNTTSCTVPTTAEAWTLTMSCSLTPTPC